MPGLDLTNLSVIDGHCHAFLPERETEPFERYLSISMSSKSMANTPYTFLYKQVERELSRVLNCEPQEAFKKRNEMYRTDPVGLVRTYYQDAKIDTMLVDVGYPSLEWSGYTIPITEFQRLVPCKVRPIYRIDNIIMKMVAKGKSFQQTADALNEEIDQAVKQERAVSLKSIVAYFTGLDVKRVPWKEAERSFARLRSVARKGKRVQDAFWRNPWAKKVMDHFLFVAAERSMELNVPIQIHTGIGEAPAEDLRLANPLLLYDLISDPALEDAKIVMAHCGYPYVEEVGFLVNTYPNVYVDLSEMVPFISVGIKDRILRLFEMAPVNKIMYGSDGDKIPEVAWIASLEAKRALGAALDELILSNQASEGWAMEIARRIFVENSREVYRLET